MTDILDELKRLRQRVGVLERKEHPPAATTLLGTGTIGRLPYFSGASALADSPVLTDGIGISIGTGQAPLTLLDLYGTGGGILVTRMSSPTSGAGIAIRKIGTGNIAVANGGEIGVLTFAGYDGSAYQVRARFRGVVDGTVSAGTVPIALAFLTSGTSAAGVERMRIASSGNIGIGQTNPTARLHMPAGAAAAGGAPLKLTAGTNLSVVENGAIEFDGTNLYFTVGGVRKTVTLV